MKFYLFSKNSSHSLAIGNTNHGGGRDGGLGRGGAVLKGRHCPVRDDRFAPPTFSRGHLQSGFIWLRSCIKLGDFKSFGEGPDPVKVALNLGTELGPDPVKILWVKYTYI